FNVYGFYTMPDNPNHANEVFNNEAVTKVGGQWTYGNTRYWVPNATYYFYAYSCGSVSELNSAYGKFSLDTSNDANDGEGLPANERTLEIDNYLSDYTHQHDLVFASNTVKAETATNSPVSFQFKHILSKLQAKFTSKFPKEYTVVISNVSVGNIRNIGDYDFSINNSNNGWKNQDRNIAGDPYVYLLNTKGEGLAEGEPKDTELEVKNEIVTVNDTEVQAYAASNTAYVIPYKYEYDDVYITFDVKVMYGKDQVYPLTTLTTTTFAPEWNEGFAYLYNIAIGPEDLQLKKISFTVSEIGEWGKGGSEDLNINNN
ncbi:MAG: fimbrillin family protein, partial [Paramuribaculum sp.]|nr:fimbrillin family protein [Paramuribaculum sp.]